MWTSDTPRYLIDLEQDEATRWSEVIAAEKITAFRLAAEAVLELENVPELARWLFSRWYAIAGGPYLNEINAWANALNVSVGTVTMLNCSYELSQLRLGNPVSKLLGCTAGVRWLEGIGVVHARTLDWPLNSLGNATRLFCFRRGQREFISVGIIGYLGVLSGMLPGRYSATINWAPPSSFPSFNHGPAFVLRQTLEECDTYDEAVHRLTYTPLSASVFYTVAGVEPGQGCVIERTHAKAIIHQIGQGGVTQANHFVAEHFARGNHDLRVIETSEGESAYVNSCRRAETLEKLIMNFDSARGLEALEAALSLEPILNENTYQKMIFCPRTGELKVWRRLEARSFLLFTPRSRQMVRPLSPTSHNNKNDL
jgi:acid ceramidase